MFVNVCVCSVIGPQRYFPFHSHQKPGLSHANQTLLKQTCAFRVESLFIRHDHFREHSMGKCVASWESLSFRLSLPLFLHSSLSLSVISVQFICISSSLWGTDQMIKDPLNFPIRPTCLCFPQSSWKYTLHTLVTNTASEEHTVCWWISPPLPAGESVDSLGIILHERSDPQVYILKVLIWNANRENALSNKL